MARTPTGKRQRFEIFKRDNFTCQYCGNTPPKVILEIDHITPVSKGGSNHDLNLVTACFDCNRGKAANPLTSITPSLEAQVKEQKDRRKQIAEYNKFLMKIRLEEESDINELGTLWYNYFLEANKFTFGPSRTPTLRRFLKEIPKEQIIRAMEIAFYKHFPRGKDDDLTFRYFCGICWRTIKGENG